VLPALPPLVLHASGSLHAAARTAAATLASKAGQPPRTTNVAAIRPLLSITAGWVGETPRKAAKRSVRKQQAACDLDVLVRLYTVT
jgi:hypothetical protein